jgi:hypothetical protein
MRSLLNKSWKKATTTNRRPRYIAASLTGRTHIAKSKVAAKKKIAVVKPEATKSKVMKKIAKKETKVKSGFTLTADDLPERNPAFHATIEEKVLAVTLTSDKADAQSLQKAEKKKTNQPSQNRIARYGAVNTKKKTETKDRTKLKKAVRIAKLNKKKQEKPVESAKSEKQIAAIVPETTKAVSIPKENSGPFHVQVGSYLNEEGARGRLQSIRSKASTLLRGHGILTVTGTIRGKSYYRARFGRFSKKEANDTCSKLKNLKIDCLVVHAE